MSVPPHKVNPIYEALDARNNKQALTHCNKLLKKQPDIPLVLALKALTLSRLDDQDQALQIANNLKNSQQIDQHVLHTLSLVYKSYSDEKSIATIYESAWLKSPTNEEYAAHYFMALLRSLLLPITPTPQKLETLQTLTSLCVKFSKLFNSAHYTFWNIVCLYLHTYYNPTSKIQLVLCERLLTKFKDAGNLVEFEQLMLFIDVLERIGGDGNLARVVELVCDEGVGGKCIKLKNEKGRVVVDTIKKKSLMGDADKKEVLRVVGELVEESADDWNSLLDYVDVGLDLLGVEEVIKFVKEKQRAVESSLSGDGKTSTVRGPYLIELEVNSRIKAGKSEVKEMIAKYFQRFGGVYCCFEDLKPYLDGIDLTKVNEFVKRLGDSFADENLNTVGYHKRMTNLKKIERYYFRDGDVAVTRIEELVKLYNESEPLGRKLLATERQYGDDYLLIAGHYLVDLYLESGNSNYLLNVVELMEYGLSKSPSNFQFKILCIRCLVKLGACGRATKIAETLDIKNVQHDTLSYIITDEIELMADFSGAMFPLVKTLTVYTQNQREIPEMVARAFQYGTYSRVLEFINFSERVSNSVQRALTIRQTVRLELFRRVGNSTSVASVVGKENAGGKNGSSEVDEYLRIVDLSGLNFEGSSDNRDKTVAIEFTKDRKVLNGISNSGVFPSEKPEWIKQYTLIPKILKQIVVGGIDDELQTLLSELEKHQTDIAKVIVSGVQLIFEQTKNEEMDDSKIDTVCSILIENANNVEKFGPNWKKVGEMIRLSTETLELFIVTSIILRKLQSYLPPQTKKQKKTATITQSAESSKNAAKVITFKERVVESRTKMVGVMKLWQDLVAGEEVFGDCVDEFKSDAWSLVKEAKMMEKVTKNLKEDWSVSLKNLSSGFSAKEV